MLGLPWETVISCTCFVESTALFHRPFVHCSTAAPVHCLWFVFVFCWTSWQPLSRGLRYTETRSQHKQSRALTCTQCRYHERVSTSHVCLLLNLRMRKCILHSAAWHLNDLLSYKKSQVLKPHLFVFAVVFLQPPYRWHNRWQKWVFLERKGPCLLKLRLLNQVIAIKYDKNIFWSRLTKLLV